MDFSIDESNKHIAQFCDDIKTFLIEKNTKHKNAALTKTPGLFPISLSTNIRVMLNHKLEHLAIDLNDDAIRDVSGYFVLLRIALARESYVAETTEHRDLGASVVEEKDVDQRPAAEMEEMEEKYTPRPLGSVF